MGTQERKGKKEKRGSFRKPEKPEKRGKKGKEGKRTRGRSFLPGTALSFHSMHGHRFATPHRFHVRSDGGGPRHGTLGLLVEGTGGTARRDTLHTLFKQEYTTYAIVDEDKRHTFTTTSSDTTPSSRPLLLHGLLFPRPRSRTLLGSVVSSLPARVLIRELDYICPTQAPTKMWLPAHCPSSVD